MHKYRNNNYCHLKPVTDINTDSKDKIIVTGLRIPAHHQCHLWKKSNTRIPCTIFM